ncbi:unnamed protein product [Chrysodeixis includens]|uniref:Uncharacterized protein n=1 Tax=Chrysodeixis includens TaxID=689277 RepID=A0A9P0BSP4_CHRIL|nr:unnamed protein product [Chrysodeixis includens]
MYTPNPDKQLLIPDLPYDSGDELLLVTTETVNTIFNSNSNRIKIYDNHFEKLKPDETVYWPIGLNHGAIEHIPPKVKEPINYQTNEYAYGQIGYDKLPNSNTIFRPTDETNPETGGSFWYSTNNMQQFNAHQSSYYNVKKRTPSYPYSKLNYDGNYNAKVGQYSSGSFADISRPTSISEQPYTSSYWSSSPNAGPPLGNVRRKLSDVKIEHHVEPPKLKNRKQLQDDRNSVPDGLDEPNEGKGGSMVANLFEPLLGKNTSASGKNFHLPSLNGVMKSLLVLLSDSRSAEEDNDDENLENLSSNDTNSTEEVDIISESEDINDGERPDYRIIGGNPATGSGTPLSNKGRSAVNDK